MELFICAGMAEVSNYFSCTLDSICDYLCSFRLERLFSSKVEVVPCTTKLILIAVHSLHVGAIVCYKDNAGIRQICVKMHEAIKLPFDKM